MLLGHQEERPPVVILITGKQGLGFHVMGLLSWKRSERNRLMDNLITDFSILGLRTNDNNL